LEEAGKMNSKLLLGVSLLLTALASAQSPASIAGRWEATKQGAPWVKLNLTDDNGQLHGTAVFFISDRDGHRRQPEIRGQQQVDLINLKRTANVLTFNIKNDQGAVVMNPASGATITFRMKLLDEKTGTLQSDAPGTEPAMIRKQ
jgi:hypothetical protein